MANHKLSIDTTQDPCRFSLDSTFKYILRFWECACENEVTAAEQLKPANILARQIYIIFYGIWPTWV
jgi:hypothetical protein